MKRSEGWNNLLDKKQVLVARSYIMDENPNITSNVLMAEWGYTMSLDV